MILYAICLLVHLLKFQFVFEFLHCALDVLANQLNILRFHRMLVVFSYILSGLMKGARKLARAQIII